MGYIDFIHIGGERQDIQDHRGERLALTDGYYEEMTVGDAEQLVATVGVNDKVPYLFRTSGGSADIGDREVGKIVGASFPWNQMNKNNIGSSSSKGVTLATNNDGSATISGENDGTASSYVYFMNQDSSNPFIENHVYLLTTGNYYNDNGARVYALGGSGAAIPSGKNAIIRKATATEGSYVRALVPKDGTIDGTITVVAQLFDLTQMFGSTIAEYVLSLETSTPGAGVAWFRKLFPKPYYAYNAGKMESVCADLHKMTGFNAYNPETGKAKVLGGYQYEIVGTYTSLSIDGETITPVSGKFTPVKDGEITVTGGDSTTTCIHLVWDGERDGEYEPYVAHSYDLDPVVLRGIPYLDSGNKLAYRGDVYHPDGTVDRLFAEVDLGTLDWSYNSGQLSMVSTGLDGLVGDGLNVRCDKYTTITNIQGTVLASLDKVVAINKANVVTTGNFASGAIVIKDTDYTDAATFKAAMSGVKLVYELATPTTEEANPYQTPQIVDDWGTEEYVDALATAATNPRDVAIPVGHDTTYRNNLRAKLEMAPESPSGDGDYILRQTSGQNEYVLLEKELPSLPSEDGTYTLKCTVSGSTKTLTWESDAE